jgi:hypothetical protein
VQGSAQVFSLFLGLAELAELNLQGKEQVIWLQRLNGDHENFRAALEWVSHHGQYEMVARIAGALHIFRMYAVT